MTTTNKDRLSQDGPVHDLETIIQLAGDSEAPPELLRNLAKADHPGVGWHLACNPNTPPDVLERLFVKHPLAVLENTILSYKVFTQGQPLHRILSIEVKLALYAALRRSGREEDLEVSLPTTERCIWLSRPEFKPDPGRFDPQQMAEVQTLLATDPSAKVRECMVDRLSPEFMLPFATDPETVVRFQLAALNKNFAGRGDRKNLPPGRLTNAIKSILSMDSHHGVRAELAASLHLPPDIHERLANDSSSRVRLGLAATPQYNRGIRERAWRTLILTGSEEALLVAQNPTCPRNLRLELTNYVDEKVRKAAWKNMNFDDQSLIGTLLQAIDQLLMDPDRVTEAVALANNAGIPEAIFERLTDASPIVTRALAENPLLGVPFKERLLVHPDEATAVLALKSMSPCSQRIAKVVLSTGRKALRIALAELPGCGPAGMRPLLAGDPEVEVRAAVACYLTGKAESYEGTNINASLDRLARDGDPGIRLMVAGDYRLSADSLTTLSTDADCRIRQRLLARHCMIIKTDLGLLDTMDPDIRMVAAELILSNKWRGDSDSRAGYSEKIASDPCPSVRIKAAASPHSSPRALEMLVNDSDAALQRAMAERPLHRTLRPTLLLWTSINLKKRRRVDALMQSSNPYLRAMAAALTAAGSRRLLSLAGDNNWFVRLAAAGNARLESNLLAQLVEDSHPLVRERAQTRIQRPTPVCCSETLKL